MFRTALFIILVCLLMSASAGAGIERRLGEGREFPFDITEEEVPECVDDGNNTALDADPIENSSYVLDVVCAEDPFDFYTFTLPAGADTDGYIYFMGTGPGTVVRLADSGGVLFEQATTADNNRIMIPVNVAASVGGTYTMRVSYYSSYDTDHVYFIGLLLEFTGCYAEGNESHTGAGAIEFRDRIDDVLCDNDPSDWYRFDPTPDELDDGWVRLDPMGSSLRLIIARAGGTELHSQMVSGDAVKVEFSDVPGMSMAITYYLAVELLDATPGEEYEYKLQLGRGDPTALSTMTVGTVHVIPVAPAWPCPKHDKYGTARTSLRGPGNVHTNETHIIGWSEIHMNSMQAPTVGPNGEIYVVIHGTPSDKLAQLAYDGSVVWSRTLQDKLAGPFLASDGIWTANRDYIYHFTYAHEQTSLQIPNVMGAGGGKLIGVYDNRLYLKAGDGNNELWCLDKSGNVIYHESTIGVLRGLAVDMHNNAFTTSLMGITKFNSDGSVAWRFQYAPMSTVDVDNPYGVGYEMGPWIGKDGRILFATHINTREGEPTLILFNQDGSEVKKFVKRFNTLPQAVCIDLDGNYYIADNDGGLIKYNSSLETQWTRSITGEVHDMIIDATPFIFLSCGVGGGFDAYNIHSFDLDGNLRWNHIPDDLTWRGTQLGWLRVVNKNELCMLTNTGYIYIMKSQALDFTPSEPGTLQPKISGVSGTLSTP